MHTSQPVRLFSLPLYVEAYRSRKSLVLQSCRLSSCGAGGLLLSILGDDAWLLPAASLSLDGCMLGDMAVHVQALSSLVVDHQCALYNIRIE